MILNLVLTLEHLINIYDQLSVYGGNLRLDTHRVGTYLISVYSGFFENSLYITIPTQLLLDIRFIVHMSCDIHNFYVHFGLVQCPEHHFYAVISIFLVCQKISLTMSLTYMVSCRYLIRPCIVEISSKYMCVYIHVYQILESTQFLRNEACKKRALQVLIVLHLKNLQQNSLK